MKRLLGKHFISLFLIAVSLLLCFDSTFFVNKTARYSGYGEAITYSSTVTETVTFTRKEETYIETVNGVPLYTQLSTLSNSCGPTAGAIIVGFYDYYYDNLIPDYAPCLSTGVYKKNDRVAIPKLMEELYVLMRTNIDDVGVDQSDCVNGLKSYVEKTGHSITYTNIRSNSTINLSSLTSSININKPSLVFCSKMDLYMMATTSNKDSISYNSYVGGHVVVGYGLYSVKYYNGNNMFREDNYMRVATGLSGIDSAYIKLSSTGWCNAAFAVDIQ